MPGRSGRQRKDRQRVLLLCASTLFCEGIHYLLRDDPGIDVVGVETLEPSSLKTVGTLQPDVVIIAENDPSSQVMLFTGQVLESYADLPVLRVSLADDTVHVYQSHQVPARRDDLKGALRHLRGLYTRLPLS